MDDKFFYKIVDMEDDRYIVYLYIDEPVEDFIYSATYDYLENNYEREDLVFFIDKYFKENEINYSIIDFIEVRY